MYCLQVQTLLPSEVPKHKREEGNEKADSNEYTLFGLSDISSFCCYDNNLYPLQIIGCISDLRCMVSFFPGLLSCTLPKISTLTPVQIPIDLYSLEEYPVNKLATRGIQLRYCMFFVGARRGRSLGTRLACTYTWIQPCTQPPPHPKKKNEGGEA